MSTIYKAYDVRGLYPEELDENTARLIGKACVLYLKENNLLKELDEILIGRDVRNSSPVLVEALMEAVVSAGVNVDYTDMITTDALYFGVGTKNYAGGIMVTASHNPPHYNGFKFVARGVEVVSGTALQAMVEKLERADLTSDTRGRVTTIDIFEDFASYIASRAGVKRLPKRFKVVADPGNGTMTAFLPKILDKFPLDAQLINDQPDGSFPGRGPNPSTNFGRLPEEVVSAGADFGIAWDNDADRIFFVDEKGRTTAGDQILSLVARQMLKDTPGMKVVYDAYSSKSVKEVVEENGGVTEQSRVGSIFVKEKMTETQALLGGEVSAHIFFKFEDHGYTWYAECTWLTIACVMHLMAETGKKLSELLDEITRYQKSDVLLFETTEPKPVIDFLATQFTDGKHSHLDGLTVEYEDWWFCGRPSNTEPMIKLVVEARSRELLDEKVAEIRRIIESKI